jgi:Raf kinase inhibitor-like YbhB/YbcL family protein
MKTPLRVLIVVGSLLALALSFAAGIGVATAAPRTAAGSSSSAFTPFTLSSPAFRDGGFLPVSASYNGINSGIQCPGRDIAPTLRWVNPPAGTKSFALTLTDYDTSAAGGLHHWVVYNIPATVSALPASVQNPYSEGTNSKGSVGYRGFCPPPNGQLHHYVFTLYALTIPVVAGTALTYDQLMSEISAYVADSTSMIGKFRLPLEEH